ncbi:hypothetical protein ACJZ2D_009104 [Fusarium nematophilum]
MAVTLREQAQPQSVQLHIQLVQVPGPDLDPVKLCRRGQSLAPLWLAAPSRSPLMRLSSRSVNSLVTPLWKAPDATCDDVLRAKSITSSKHDDTAQVTARSKQDKLKHAPDVAIEPIGVDWTQRGLTCGNVTPGYYVYTT